MISLDAIQEFWTAYGNSVILSVGAATALVAVVLGWRWFRHGEAHQRTGTLAVVLATLFSAEGMWEVARGALHLEVYLALVLFGVFEVVMVNQGLLAKHKLANEAPTGARRHMRFVWLIAFATGGIASTNSSNLTEFLLRLTVPSVAAGIWWTTLTADGIAKVKSAVTFRWSPRRLALWLGIIEPGENDVKDVDRARRLDTLIDLVHLRQTGKLSARQARRLARLERHADDEMLDEVIRRMGRSVWFKTTLDTPAPAAVPAPSPAPAQHPRLISPINPAAPVPAPPTAPRVNGAGTPPAAPPLAGVGTPALRLGTPPMNTPVPPPNGTGTVTPAPPVTSGGTPDGTPGDEELLAVLRDPARVPREGDGTVPIKRATRVLGVGRTRAIRLLDTLGLRRYPDPDDGTDTPGGTPAAEGSDDDSERHPAPLIDGRHPAMSGV